MWRLEIAATFSDVACDVPMVADISYVHHPCLCLCFGFVGQITRMTPCLLMILQSLQMVFTDDLTTMFSSRFFVAIGNRRYCFWRLGNRRYCFVAIGNRRYNIYL